MSTPAVICIVILCLLILFLLARLILIGINVREITRELKNNRERDYDRQLRILLHDRAFNRMATEMNRNLSYQKELKLQEEAARKQLERSVSDIAHDLRTPLTVIKGNLQLLENEPLSEEGRKSLDVSRRKAESLKNMVDEFFELSVLESDTQDVSLKKLDLVTFLSAFIIDHESMIREKGLTPEILFPERSVFVNANEDFCSRVFSNLLANICKYAKDSFTIRVSPENGVVTLCNRISSADEIDTEHIFDRTYRADKARREGSAGLGLYIAKLLMEKQGGSITAEVKDGEILFTLKWGA